MNTITGTSGKNILDGGAGLDTLIGGAGDDTYVLGADSDTVSDSDGIDTITSTITRSLAGFSAIEKLILLGTGNINGTGNGLVNTINGNSGKNILDGGVGHDTLVGGAGDDTYVLGAESDTISDSSGIDTITSTITRSLAGFSTIEKLILLGTGNINGTGNGLVNTINGNSGQNTLDGGGGHDTLVGGAGNDTYVLGAESDTVSDSAGIDTVTSTISRSLASFGTIEKLTLLGTGNINGTGNGLANTITGNAGKNVLEGGAGLDALIGGAGDDTYVLGAENDTVSDSAGRDTITSTITRSLTGFSSIENLTLLGTGNIDGTGNTLDNIVLGNAGKNTLAGGNGKDALKGNGGDDILKGDTGDDILFGGLGKDTLTGGANKDIFVFDTALGSSNVDHLTDFSVVDDTIHLENAVFTVLTVLGTLAGSAFVKNTTGKAVDGNDRVIYETDTGNLFYDSNGSGSGGSVLFATLNKNLALTSNDFVVV
ncbi:calcium-binding protein [Rhizobium sp. Root1212]|uniref:calcium-binding protein n=1 Tax=Rhizobium sp. Root1212 TaxID=1736429 RepID=UPI00138ED87F|nr:calcium-binding protein [Rhizobium sp. Root1212]